MAPATKGTSNRRVNKNFYLTFSLAAQAKERTAPLLLFLLWLAEVVMAAFARTKYLFGLGAYGIGFTVSRSDGKLVGFVPQGISRFDEIIPLLPDFLLGFGRIRRASFGKQLRNASGVERDGLGVDLDCGGLASLKLIIQLFGVVTDVLHQIGTKGDGVFAIGEMLGVSLMRQAGSEIPQSSGRQHCGKIC